MTALSGLRVLEVGGHLPGSLAGMVLADAGAEVLRVEPPGGARERGSPAWHVRNRGKRSTVADLATPAGRDAVRQLAAGADAMIWDLRPGLAERWGMTHDRLAADNPGLCQLVVTGFGERGPWRDLPGHESVVSAVTGRMASTIGHRDGPIFTPVPVASFGAAMLGVAGLLAALHERDTTGRGRRVHTSLLHALVSYDMTSGHGHRIHQRDDSGAVYGVMPLAFMTAPTADGRWIQMCSRQPHLYRSWMRVLGLEDLYDDPAYHAMPDTFPDRAALETVRTRVRDAMRTRTLDDWLQAFAREDVGGDPFLEAGEWLRHPQAEATGRTVVVHDPELGPLHQVGPLAAMTGTPARVDRPAPALGPHVDAVTWTTGAPPPAPRAASSASRPLPLEGVTVLDVAWFYAAPWASALLWEMGARVIKVEPPSGDPARRNWTTPYDKETAGKESVVLDLKSAEGQEQLCAMVPQVDVFVHNFRPGVPERLGIASDDLLALHPGLVYVYAGCFGSTGPWARRPGFHSSPNAITGAGILEAGAGNPPQNRTYADPAAALASATAIMVALRGTRRTGRGQYVETTMLASMAMAMSAWSTEVPGRPTPTVDAGQHGFGALHRLYRASDGWVVVVADDDRSFGRLAEALDVPGLATDERFRHPTARQGHDDALAEILAPRIAAATADAVVTRLRAVEVTAARADGIDHANVMRGHPHLRENGLVVRSHVSGVGVIDRASGSVEFTGSCPRVGLPAPLGSSTERVLREFGALAEPAQD